jgi:hypothetical protein
MTDGSEDHVAAICPFKKLNSVLVVRLWLNWTLRGVLRWKGKDR